MSMEETLKKIAISRLWANPHADTASITRPVRLSRGIGNVWCIQLPYDEIELPDTTTRYAVFEYGHVAPNEIAVPKIARSWLSLEDLMNTKNIFFQAFVKGRMLSLDGAYYQLTESGNLIFAFEYAINAFLLNMDDSLYIRFYSHLFYKGNPIGANDMIHHSRLEYDPSVPGSYISFSLEVDAVLTNTGQPPLVYWNGLYCPDGVPPTGVLALGDLLTYSSDPRLEVLDQDNVDLLESFNSSMDNRHKLIISFDHLETRVYADDLEVYITGVMANGVRVGVYYPKLYRSTIRMLSFKDWALDANMFHARLNELEEFSDVDQTLSDRKVHVFRRMNREFKPGMLDSHRIPDMQNLPTNIRRQVLAGVNSNLSIWEADSLEQCFFNQWISKEALDVLSDGINGVFSRFGAIEYLSRVWRDDQSTDWRLPPLAGNEGGVLQRYNPDGTGPILDVYFAGDHINEPYANGRGIENFYPNQLATAPLDTIVNSGVATPLVLEDGFGIFVYYDNGGTLVTAVSGVDYTLTDDEDAGTTTIDFGVHIHGFTRYVRTSQKRVEYTVNFTLNDIIDGFDIYQGRAKAHDVGMGSLRIWFNGRYLIEGLDYHMHNGLCHIVSITDDWLLPAPITVLYSGLPDHTLNHVDNDTRWGWILYGKMTNNDLYDLYLYRNRTVFVNGRAHTYEEIPELEGYVDQTDQAYITMTDGHPFAIVDCPQFLRDEELDTFTSTKYGEKALDESIINYLSAINPQTIETGLIVTPSDYDLVSPLMNKLIQDIVDGTYVVPSEIQSDIFVLAEINPYAWMLAFDPCSMSHDVDRVEIRPRWDSTVVNMDLKSFSFINKVNELLLDSQVEGINLFVNVV